MSFQRLLLIPPFSSSLSPSLALPTPTGRWPLARAALQLWPPSPLPPPPRVVLAGPPPLAPHLLHGSGSHPGWQRAPLLRHEPGPLAAVHPAPKLQWRRFPSLPVPNPNPIDLALISISMLQIQWRRGGADLGMIWRQGLQDGSRWLLQRRGGRADLDIWL